MSITDLDLLVGKMVEEKEKEERIDNRLFLYLEDDDFFYEEPEIKKEDEPARVIVINI